MKKRINRRRIIQGGMSAAGAAAIASILPGCDGVDAPPVAVLDTTGNDYGPLSDAVDRTTGETLLRLPEGFEYRTFGDEGTPMDDGFVTPPSHDGMMAFPGPNGSVRLVRNHETQFQMGNALGAPASAEVGPNPYDPVCNGGCTILDVAPGEWGDVTSWRGLSGTYFNCSGGDTPYGTWISCEELPGGPDIGDDFFGNGVNLTNKHGYIYEVDPQWGPGEAPVPTPITQAGRMTHEGAVMDDVRGYLYLTQDDFFAPSGLYRYIPPNDTLADRRIEDGGRLQMLRVVGIDNAELFSTQAAGVTYEIDWVTIPDPDPTMPADTSFFASLGAVSAQGLAQGAAQFSRLEGIRRVGREIFFTSTQGGQGREGASSTFGPGFGQVWKLNLDTNILSLVFEAPPVEGVVEPGNQPVLSLPDNIAVSQNGTIVMGEDGTIDRADRGFVIPSNFLRGLSPTGVLFDFAQNVVGGGEFTGVTFSPDGTSLFFNIQTTDLDVGRTYEVRGPFGRGPF